MKDRVVYLLGAGASAEAMPTVANFSDTLNKLLKDARKASLQGLSGANKVVEQLQDLRGLIEGYLSPDTLAAAIWQSAVDGNAALEELKRLSRGIAVYLATCQLKQGVDRRYLNLITALRFASESRQDLPHNVAVLTWNYDMNFESTMNRFYSTSHDCQRAVQHPVTGSLDPERFTLVKLNGSVVDGSSGLSVYDWIRNAENSEYGWYRWPSTIDHGMGIRFAWTDSNEDRRRIENAILAARNATVLVTIGYSFPDYNHETDERLIKAMAPTLQKIYVQDVSMDRAQANWQRLCFRSATVNENHNGSVRTARPVLVPDASTLLVPPEMYKR